MNSDISSGHNTNQREYWPLHPLYGPFIATQWQDFTKQLCHHYQQQAQ
ncbi:hypothetical protein [Agarivorans gilvus]|nr:hypothetical protein [Agarivorans gilvus]